MKVAVVGGNLLGCATAHYLRKVEELNAVQAAAKYGPLDANRTRDAEGSDAEEPIDLVLFEARKKLGGNAFRTVTVEGTKIEIGRTLRVAKDLVYLPGLMNDLNSEKMVTLKPKFDLANGLYPSSGIFDWEADCFTFRNAEEPIFSKLYKSSAFCALVRIPLAAAAIYLGMPLFKPVVFAAADPVNRAKVTVAGLFLVLLLLIPRFFIRCISNSLTACLSTVTMVFTYSLSCVVSRGAKKGVAQQLAEMRKYNATTSSVTVGHFLYRTGMGPWIKGSMGDFMTNKFKLFPGFVQDVLWPEVQKSNVSTSSTMESVTGLQCLMDMFTADLSELTTASLNPSGEQFCEALIESSRGEIRLEAHVDVVKEDKENLGSYIVQYTSNGSQKSESFDGVVICFVPDLNTFTIDVDNVASARHLFGLTDESVTKQEISNRSADNRTQWLAIVAGELNGQYFGLSKGNRVPDVTSVVRSLNLFSIERLPKSAEGSLYRIICGEEPKEDSDVVQKLFNSVRSVQTFRRDPPRYTRRPFSNTNGDDIPAIILSGRCVYAAALDRLACHPEIDIMAATNGASLFSKSIQWKNVDEELDRSRNMRAPGPVAEINAGSEAASLASGFSQDGMERKKNQ